MEGKRSTNHTQGRIALGERVDRKFQGNRGKALLGGQDNP